MLVNLLASERRRSWFHREQLAADPHAAPQAESPTHTRTPPPGHSHDDRIDLIRALQALPMQQRRAVVLRYLEDLPTAVVADLMRCSEGNVKRSAHDGLKSLRRSLQPQPERTAP